MGEVYSIKHVKATRKPHVCEYCGNEISIGSPAINEHGIYDGRAFSRYTCADCDPFVGDFWDYVDDAACDIESEFWEWVRDFRIPHPTLTVEVDCPSCGTVRVMASEWANDGWANCPKCDALLEAPC